MVILMEKEDDWSAVDSCTFVGEAKPPRDGDGMSKPLFFIIICDLSCKMSVIAMGYSYVEP